MFKDLIEMLNNYCLGADTELLLWINKFIGDLLISGNDYQSPNDQYIKLALSAVEDLQGLALDVVE